MNDRLVDLKDQLKEAKTAEKQANTRRINIESAIYEIVKGELVAKGTNNFVDAGLKIVTGFTEKWDQEQLIEARDLWKHNIAFPFKAELKPVAKDISYLKEHAPEAYKEIEQALTLTERKPTFTVVD